MADDNRQQHGERLVRVETELQGIGRTLGRLDKTQERHATAMERLAEGFARMEGLVDHINRNSADVVALDSEVGELREMYHALQRKNSEYKSDLDGLKADQRAKWFILTTLASAGAFIGGLLFQLAVKFIF